MMMDAGPKPVLMIESDNFGGKVRWCEARGGRLIVEKIGNGFRGEAVVRRQ